MRQLMGVALIAVAVPFGLLAVWVGLLHLTSLDWYAYGLVAVYGLVCLALAGSGITILRARSPVAASNDV